MEIRKTESASASSVDGYIPPQALDIEEVVLGSMLLFDSVWNTADTHLTEDSFYKESNRLVFEAIQQVRAVSGKVDMLLVVQKMRDSGKIDKAGGVTYISGLTTRVGTPVNFEKHCMILYEKSLLRNLIRIGHETMTASLKGDDDPFEIVENVQANLLAITSRITGGVVSPITEVFKELVSKMEKAVAGDAVGFQTGLANYDKITGGWMRGDLIIVAGRPGMGKSAFLGPICHAAVAQKLRTAVFLLEMTSVQLAARLVSPIVDRSVKDMLLGRVDETIWGKLHAAFRNFYNEDMTDYIFFDDQSKTLRDVTIKSRNLKSKYGLDLIAIDYLQLMEIASFRGSREQEVSRISRGLKQLAKELDVPVVAFSQLSREVEKTEDKLPNLSHLRESGAIEQDADLVTFLFRPYYYYDQTGKDVFLEVDNAKGQKIDTENYCAAIVAKNRNGGIGNADLGFIAKYAQFKNYEEVYEQFEERPFRPIQHPDFQHSSREKLDLDEF